MPTGSSSVWLSSRLTSPVRCSSVAARLFVCSIALTSVILLRDRPALTAAAQPREDAAARVLVALIAQELNAKQDRLFHLVAERLGGSGVVIASAEAAAVDRLAKPEVEAFRSRIGVGPTPRTIGGVGKPINFS